MSWCLKYFVLLALMYVFIFLVKVTEWPPIGKIAAHSAYEMFFMVKVPDCQFGFFPPRFLE